MPLCDDEMGIAVLYWHTLSAARTEKAPMLLKYYRPDMAVGHHTAYEKSMQVWSGTTPLAAALEMLEREEDDLEYGITLYGLLWHPDCAEKARLSGRKQRPFGQQRPAVQQKALGEVLLQRVVGEGGQPPVPAVLMPGEAAAAGRDQTAHGRAAQEIAPGRGGVHAVDQVVARRGNSAQAVVGCERFTRLLRGKERPDALVRRLDAL